MPKAEDINKELELVYQKCLEEIENVKDLNSLNTFKSKYLGKKSYLTGSMQLLSQLDNNDKAVLGKTLNITKNKIQTLIDLKKSKLSEIDASSEGKDLSLPGRGCSIGTLHPITLVMDEIIQIFHKLGFEIVDGPEIEDEFHNFNALNVPEDHPARAMHDTFYFTNNKLLRTHTSSVQTRVMKDRQPPIRIIAPGKVYRKDSDMTHTPMFHQLEGLFISKNVNFGHLKNTLNIFLKNFFEDDSLQIRFRPSYFPFTEPSAEVDIGYSFSKNKFSWLEILGCGMVHPNVLKTAGINPKVYSGYAFGLGIERLAMLKLEINDLRLFFQNDLRFLTQFR